MRPLRLAILPLLVATSLAAQAPEPSHPSGAPVAAVAPQRTAFFDVAALVDHRERFGLEPLVFGRFTAGLIGTHSRADAPARVIPYANPLAGGPALAPTLCPVQGCPAPYPGSASSYRAWSLDVAVRYYPGALSLNDPRRRLMVYFGEFVGYQWRTLDEAVYAPVPLGQSTVCPIIIQPGGAPPPRCVLPPYTSTRTQRLTGWEPGAEIGARLRPLDPVFVDVGGWFKLVTLDDPMQQPRPGQLDSRLVVAVGIGW